MVVAMGLLALLAALVVATNPAPARPLLYVALGAALGSTLLAADFGFSGVFRRALERDWSGFRAHLVTFAIAATLMVPMVAIGHVLGVHIEGIAHRIGVSFLLGALLFGSGMQLAGGCASGTLFQLGGGDSKYVGTVAGFVLGSVAAASHIELWWSLPALPALTLFTLGPWPWMLAAELAAMAWLFRRIGGPRPTRRLLLGGAVLALLNAATMLVSGSAWSETWAFTLWGSQLAALAGAHPESWRFFRDVSFDVSPLVDRTSIMDLSIPLGALLAASWLGRFELRAASARAWLAATIGGIAMGYGARLSGGCNIGAYFSDIASGDLSGWVWALAALLGSALGIALRARIDPVPRAPAATSSPATS